jgi:hypothetical protein
LNNFDSGFFLTHTRDTEIIVTGELNCRFLHAHILALGTIGTTAGNYYLKILVAESQQRVSELQQ